MLEMSVRFLFCLYNARQLIYTLGILSTTLPTTAYLQLFQFKLLLLPTILNLFFAAKDRYLSLVEPIGCGRFYRPLPISTH